MQGAVCNALIVTMDGLRRILPDSGILYDQGRIVCVDRSDVIRGMAYERGIGIKDAKGAVLFPGLINTHTHVFQHLLKGLGVDMVLEDWWPKVIGPAGVQIRERHICAAAYGNVLESLRCGVTTLTDYMQVHPVSGLSDAEIETVRSTGMRLIYGRGFRNYAGDSRFPRELIENLDDVFLEVLDLKRRYESERIKIWLAPAAAWAVSMEGLKETADFSAAQNIPVMMHVFETNTDDEVCLARYGRKAIDYYDEASLLRPGFMAVHSVKSNEDVISRFSQNGVCVSHNPVSNLYLASGVAPIPAFLHAGVTVGLGTDGAASNNSNNMLESMKVTALIHKTYCGDPLAMTAQQALEMATIGAAKCIGLSDQLGSIEAGKSADFFLFDPMKSPGCCPMHDPVAALVYSSDTRGIVTVAVGGEILLDDGVFTKLDEEKLLKSEQVLACELCSMADFDGNVRSIHSN